MTDQDTACRDTQHAAEEMSPSSVLSAGESFPDQGLLRPTASGTAWIAFLSVIDRGSSFIKTLVLARLLLPGDFGLMGVGMLAISTLEVFSKTGFDLAIVQRKGRLSSEAIDSAWTLMALRGVSLFAITFAIAPLIARFFGDPRSESVVRAMAFYWILRGSASLAESLFQREMDFRKYVLIQVVPNFLDLGVSITLAVLFRNVWALVWGMLASETGRWFASYWIHPYRPRFRLIGSEAKSLFDYGKWVFAWGLLSFLLTQGDSAFIGKLLGVTALGLYQLSMRVSKYPLTQIPNILGRVTIPMYARLQEDRDRLKRAFGRVVQVIGFVTVPLAALICFLAPEMVRFILGPKWVEATPVIRTLSLAGLACVFVSDASMFAGIHRLRASVQIHLLMLGVTGALIYPLTVRFGVTGTATAIALGSFVSIPLWLYWINRTTGLSLAEFVVLMLPSVTGLGALAGVFALMQLWCRIGSSAQLLFCLLILGVTYVLAAALHEKFTGDGPLASMKMLLRAQLQHTATTGRFSSLV